MQFAINNFLLEFILSREKCSMPEPFGANHQYVDNCSGSSFTMRTKGHTGGTSGAIHPSCNFDPPTMGGPITTNHPDIDSTVNLLTSSDSMTPPVSKLYVFDKAVEVQIKCQIMMNNNYVAPF